MPEPAIRGTVTHDVRSFLAAQGVDLAPWSGLDETYAELYRVLTSRKGDARFWQPLAALLGQVLASAEPSRARLPAPAAELLTTRDIDELVRELRAALPPAGFGVVDSKAVARFVSRLNLAVAGGFLILGLAAAGCNNDPCGSAVLRDALADTAMSASQQEEVCGCFESVRMSWVNGLEELFESSSPAEIERLLWQIADCWESDPDVFDGSFTSSVERDLLNGNLCSAPEPQPAYKGVSFRRP